MNKVIPEPLRQFMQRTRLCLLTVYSHYVWVTELSVILTFWQTTNNYSIKNNNNKPLEHVSKDSSDHQEEKHVFEHLTQAVTNYISFKLHPCLLFLELNISATKKPNKQSINVSYWRCEIIWISWKKHWELSYELVQAVGGYCFCPRLAVCLNKITRELLYGSLAHFPGRFIRSRSPAGDKGCCW